MSKGQVTLLLESNKLIQDKVAKLLDYGYTRFQVSKLLNISLDNVRFIMRDNGLRELSQRPPKESDEL